MAKSGSKQNNFICRYAAQNCQYSEDQYKRDRDQRIATVLAIVLTLVPLAFGMPVAYKYSLWGFSILLSLYLAFASIPALYPLDRQQKWAASLAVFMIVFVVFWPVINKQWEAEQSAVLEGDLHPIEKMQTVPVRVMQIGQSGTRFNWQGPGNQDMWAFLYNAGLRLEERDNELIVSTPVRDRQGRLVAKIEHNHWWVTSACLDKNYTRNSLEVLDSRGEVIFQLRILPDHIEIQGEWRDEFGNGARLAQAPEGGANLTIWHDPTKEQSAMQIIYPIFKYPSALHWGELVQSAQP